MNSTPWMTFSSADGVKLLDAGTKLSTGSATNANGFAWFDVDVPIRSESYPDSGNSGRYRIVEITALRVTCWTAPCGCRVHL